MANSNRKQSHGRRKVGGLVFESLETRRSLTSASGALADSVADTADAAALASFHGSAVQSVTVDAFLRYVASLDEVNIERALPSQADSDAVDQLIAATSPADALAGDTTGI